MGLELTGFERQAGLAWGLIENIADRPMSLDEIHQFCFMLFIREGRQEVTSKKPWNSW